MYIIKHLKWVSISKLVLRLWFVRAYINIYTCPLEKITLYVYDLIDPMMVKGGQGCKRTSFESFFNLSDISVTHTFSFPGTNASGCTGLDPALLAVYEL